MNQTLINNLNAKQLRAINRLNAKIEAKAKVDFFNNQKVETSTKSSRWGN